MDIKLDLLLPEVNILLNALAQMPYAQVVDTLEKIKNQTKAQIDATAQE